VIDLHCHILPGLDDGPANIDFSMAMARTAAECGTQILVATPHVRADYPDVTPEVIEAGVETLNRRLAEEDLALSVLPGAEVSFTRIADIEPDDLPRFCLGDSSCLLLEAPVRRATIDVERAVEAIQERGLKPVLAHPERSSIFLKDPQRLEGLVERGALCSITAASMSGGFGERVQRFAVQLLVAGLVHDVASDAHDHVHRPPDLVSGFDELESQLPGIREHSAWFTVTAPVAILAGRPVPPAPELVPAAVPRWRRVIGRTRA
jgi:protein-tyrosine phosphatase